MSPQSVGEIDMGSWRFTRVKKPRRVLKLSSVQKRKEMGL